MQLGCATFFPVQYALTAHDDELSWINGAKGTLGCPIVREGIILVRFNVCLEHLRVPDL